MIGTHAVIRGALGAVVLGLTTLAVPAEAQGPMYTHRGDAIVVDIPFEFVAGDTTLPAGKYRVQIGDTSSDARFMVTIEEKPTGTGDEKLSYVNLMTTPSGKADAAWDHEQMLVFEKVGDRYFLAEVRPADGGQVREVPRSSETDTEPSRDAKPY